MEGRWYPNGVLHTREQCDKGLLLLPSCYSTAGSWRDADAAAGYRSAWNYGENLTLAAAKELAAKLEAAFEAEGAVIKKKVGPNGDIFGSVTGGDLSEHIKSRTGFKVDKKAISVASVTSVGSAAATLSLHKQVSIELKFEVVSA